MRFVSTFAGVGGFDIALERAGMTCAGQVEIDKHATKVLARNWPEVPRHDDIRTAGPWGDSLGDVDLVCGGFPCQDLSVAGKRAGLDGARSGLFFDLVAFADRVGARYLLLENVVGLLTSHQGRDFGVVLNTLADSGYVDIEWCVLDAQHFGVPQRRRRVFILARRGGAAGGGPVFAESAGCKRHPGAGIAAGQDAAAGVGGGAARGRGTPIVAALTSTGVGTCGADDNQAQAGHLVAYVKAKRAQNGVRRLTPVECERLQGFPDNWTATGSDSQRYKQMGNAVAVPCVEWIAHRIAGRAA